MVTSTASLACCPECSCCRALHDCPDPNSTETSELSLV